MAQTTPGYPGGVQVELGDGVGRVGVVRWPVVGWGVDTGSGDVGIEQRPELLVEPTVGEGEPLVQVGCEPHGAAVRRFQSPVEADSSAGELAQADVVSAVLAGDVRIAAEPGSR